MTKSKILQYQICHISADFKLSNILRVIDRILLHFGLRRLEKKATKKEATVISYGKLMHCECRWCREPGVDYD